jgi:hypothetical protein
MGNYGKEQNQQQYRVLDAQHVLLKGQHAQIAYRRETLELYSSLLLLASGPRSHQ